MRKPVSATRRNVLRVLVGLATARAGQLSAGDNSIDALPSNSEVWKMETFSIGGRDVELRRLEGVFARLPSSEDVAGNQPFALDKLYKPVDTPDGFSAFSKSGVQFFKQAPYTSNYLNFDTGTPDPAAGPDGCRTQARSASVLVSNRGQAFILANEYLVRFSIDGEPPEAPNVACRQRLAGPFNTWLVGYDTSDIRLHKASIETWRARGLVVYAEPNLTSRLETHGDATCQPMPLPYPDREVPSDPGFPCQENLTRQQVPEAWWLLKRKRPADRFGSADITIGILDSTLPARFTAPGSDKACADFPARDGSMPHSFRYVDLGGKLFESEPEPTCHALAMFGIIGASTGNGRGISGIASGASHLVVAYRDLTDQAHYGSTLLWMAGLADAIPIGSHEKCLARGCDVINLSHGLGMVSSYVREVIRFIATSGRQGQGTVIVCSTGNSDGDISMSNDLVTCDGTIAVANTLISFDTGREQRATASGRGLAVDLSALGQDAMTLSPDPNLQYYGCRETTGISGVLESGGTSAASATISGIAGLVLSANPDLTRDAVEQVLRDTADKIDCGNIDPEGRWCKRYGDELIDPEPGMTPERGSLWFSKWYGYGRVNAFEAVKKALEMRHRRCDSNPDTLP